MRTVVSGVEAEFRRYRELGEGTFDQVSDAEIGRRPTPESNSIATIAWHIAGNLESRFTDFLTSDGEKPWREREKEFAHRPVSVAEVRVRWAEGWSVLTAALSEIRDEDLSRTVRIRGVPFSVGEAVHRSLAHTASHVGQITYLGKMLRGPGWRYLSIEPGGTEAYNTNPTREKP